jgi:hypothetical protein
LWILVFRQVECLCPFLIVAFQLAGSYWELEGGNVKSKRVAFRKHGHSAAKTKIIVAAFGV